VIAAVAAVVIVALTIQNSIQRRQISEKELIIAGRDDESTVTPTPPRPSLIEPPSEARVPAGDDPAAAQDALTRQMKRGEQLAAILGSDANPLTKLLVSDETAPTYAPISIAQRLGSMVIPDIRAQERERLSQLNADAIEEWSADAYYIAALSDTRDGPQSGNDAAVRELLDRALMLDGSHLPALQLRAWVACRQNDGAAAVADAETALQLAPNSKIALLARAAGHYLDGDQRQALEDLDSLALQQQEAVSLSSDFRVDALRALVLVELGDAAQAELAASRALQFQPDDVLARMTRARLSKADRRVLAAIQDITAVLNVEPKNADAFVLRGECYEQLKVWERAIADFSMAHEISGDSALVLRIAGAAISRDQQRLEEEEKMAQAEAVKQESERAVNKKIQPETDRPLSVQDLLEQFLSRPADDAGGVRFNLPRLGAPSLLP
jgi:tetratricopeptide (TPR) repeat protein